MMGLDDMYEGERQRQEERRRRKKRVWSAEEKRKIVAACCDPGARPCDVARRFGVHESLVFKWRRDGRYAAGDGASGADDVPAPAGALSKLRSQAKTEEVITAKAQPEPASFIPVVVAEPEPDVACTCGIGAASALASDVQEEGRGGGMIRIVLAGGHRVEIYGAFDGRAAGALLAGPGA
jgi:transposase